ncbi:homoserine/homoserine lactone efflux protein [Catenovulum agarivorans DS-2]|uniref:Homoserine/homoserine lactone efflux protein n=1 Tax=Catenovulum agarivorans DS-2 TaxID=1328313 RepID=W7QSX0_9ALTE|nr:LysE family transporter [Catenovulum agarivorans]EWH10978.1 homoserine/homoserine lactone efflux protein [Catenovulum agarivorans DS-2]
MNIDIWLAYLISCIFISLSPGAGAVACMSSGLKYGFKTAYWNVIGMQLAIIVQMLIVAAGIGSIVANSPTLFEAIKWFGAAYLIYLAYIQWRVQPQSIQFDNTNNQAKVGINKLVLQGFLVNMTNPKAIVFLLAIIPQFIDMQLPISTQYVILLLTMVSVDLVVMGGYTGLAATSLKLLSSPQQQIKVNRCFACMFVVAASLLVLANV